MQSSTHLSTHPSTHRAVPRARAEKQLFARHARDCALVMAKGHGQLAPRLHCEVCSGESEVEGTGEVEGRDRSKKTNITLLQLRL